MNALPKSRTQWFAILILFALLVAPAANGQGGNSTNSTGTSNPQSSSGGSNSTANNGTTGNQSSTGNTSSPASPPTTPTAPPTSPPTSPPSTTCRPTQVDENNYLAMLRSEPNDEEGTPSYTRSGSSGNAIVVRAGTSFDVDVHWFSYGNDLGPASMELYWGMELMNPEVPTGGWEVRFQDHIGPTNRITVVSMPNGIEEGSNVGHVWIRAVLRDGTLGADGEPLDAGRLELLPVYLANGPVGSVTHDAHETPYGQPTSCGTDNGTGNQTTPDDGSDDDADSDGADDPGEGNNTSGADEGDDSEGSSVEEAALRETCSGIATVRILDLRNVALPASLTAGPTGNLVLAAYGFDADGAPVGKVEARWRLEGDTSIARLSTPAGTTSTFTPLGTGAVAAFARVSVDGQVMEDSVQFDITPDGPAAAAEGTPPTGFSDVICTEDALGGFGGGGFLEGIPAPQFWVLALGLTVAALARRR